MYVKEQSQDIADTKYFFCFLLENKPIEPRNLNI